MKLELDVEESVYSLDLQDVVKVHESVQQTVWNFRSPVEGENHIIDGIVLPKFCGLFFLVLRRSDSQKILFPSLWLRRYVERYLGRGTYTSLAKID